MVEGQKGSGDDVERGHLALPCDPSPMPFDKYRSHVPLVLHDRTWPDRQFTHAPRWASVDLRDGATGAIVDDATWKAANTKALGQMLSKQMKPRFQRSLGSTKAPKPGSLRTVTGPLRVSLHLHVSHGFLSRPPLPPAQQKTSWPFGTGGCERTRCGVRRQVSSRSEVEGFSTMKQV